MNVLVDYIGEIVAALRPTVVPDPDAKGAGAPYYTYGHRLEIAEKLLQKSQDKIYKYQKYPLVALRLDTPEKIVGNVIQYLGINIAFLTLTDKNYTTEERYEFVFKPILYPLYESFFVELKNSGLFMWQGHQSVPPHTKIDRPFWGTQYAEGNQKNIFNDPIDAIEVINLQMNSIIDKC